MNFRKIQKLCRSVGFEPIEKSWDGWYGPMKLAGTSAHDLSHELGHAIVAAPWRRRRKFFGLGSPGPYHSLQLVSDEYAMDEEAEASLMGILIERQTGGDHISHWIDHNWSDHLYTAVKVLRRLRRKGVIERSSRGYAWNGKLYSAV